MRDYGTNRRCRAGATRAAELPRTRQGEGRPRARAAILSHGLALASIIGAAQHGDENR